MISVDSARTAPERESRWHSPSLPAIGAAVFVVTLVALMMHNRDVFTSSIYEDGDFAVNSILIDRAKHLQLLIGNYSRVGFHHPGPGLLYVQALSELLFHDLIPLTKTPYGAHELGAMILGSAMVGVSGAIIYAHVRSLLAPLALLVIVFAYVHHEPGMLSSTWMPNLYVWPFVLMVIAGGSVLAGRHQDVWAATLAACFLIHGHVSFTAFVGLTTLATVGVLAYRRRQTGDWGLPRWSVALTAGIVALFLLPIAVNLLINWPGEVDDYWRYSRSDDAGGHPWGDVVSFVKSYWIGGRAAGVLVLVLVVALTVGALTVRRLPGRPFLLGLLAMVGITSVAMFFYASRGVDDLSFDYVGRFYFAAPMATLLVAALFLIAWRPERIARGAMCAVLAIAVIALGASSSLDHEYAGSPWLPAATDAIVAAAPSTVALRFDVTTWPQAAGIVEYLRREDRPVCVDAAPQPLWPVLFTDEVICAPTELRESTLFDVLPPTTSPTDDDVVVNAAVVVRRAAS